MNYQHLLDRIAAVARRIPNSPHLRSLQTADSEGTIDPETLRTQLDLDRRRRRLLADELQALVEELPASLGERSSGHSDRDRVEQKLLHEKNLSDTIVDSLPGAFFILAEDNHLLRWNRQLERACGYTSEDIERLDPMVLFAPSERSRLRAHIEAAFACGEASTEATLVGKDGNKSTWFISGRCLDLDGQRCLLGVATDITQRQRAEVERQKLAALVENSTDFIGIADLDGRIEFLNPAGCRLVDAEAASGTIADYLGPNLAKCFDREVLPVVRDRGQWNGETVLRGRGDRQIPVSINAFLIRDCTTGNPLKIATIARDISTSKRVEAELQASDEKCRSVVDGLKEVIFQTDAAGCWTFLNPAWTELTGFDTERNLGRPIAEFVHPDEQTRHRQHFAPLLAAKKDTCRYEIRFHTCSGGDCWLELAARARRNANGAIVGTTGTLNDITERKQAEDRLRAVIDTVPGFVSWVGRDGRYLGVNQRMAQTLNLTPEDLVGQELGFLKTSPSYANFMRDFLASSRQTASQTIATQTNGTARTYLIAAQKYRQGSAAVSVGIDITERKQAELALRESEEKFRQLAENIEQVFWMTDLSRQEAIYVSPAYEQTWGRSLETAYCSPQDWLLYVHPHDRDRVAAALPLQLYGEYDIEYRLQRPNGEVRWIHDRAFPVRDGNGHIYRLAGIAQDITESKRAKEALERRERYLTALVGVQRRLLAAGTNRNLYSEAISILGLVSAASRIHVYENTCDENGCWRAHERAAWHAPDVPPNARPELDYSTLSDDWRSRLLAGEIRQGIVAELPAGERHFFSAEDALAFLVLPLFVNGNFFGSIVFDNCREAREWQPLEVGLLSSAAAAIALAKERQLAQEQLQRQLTAIETTTDGIFIVNAADELQYVNPAYVQMLGYDNTHDLLGTHWCDYYPSEDSDPIATKLRPELLTAGKWSGEIDALHRSGRTFVQELSVTATATGEAIGVCRDISDRKLAECELKASLEEKELLLKEVHHRVKNNLQVISSIFSLQSQAIADPQALALLEDSQNRIGSMALIHEKLYQSARLANIDFSDYIRDLTEHLIASYNANPAWIETDTHIDDVRLTLDSAIPCGLLINELVSNALKHAFPDGRRGRIAIEFRTLEDGNLRLRVEDNGVGLPEGLDSNETNSLGLSLIASLAEQLRGRLQVTNTTGACFEVVFPQPQERRRF
ncbi:PAS domain S-box [Rubidibacter lacunae KORDI 51-2]|uniref:histidine kinase n=1 Tax=Rubidibacter lacunae KORDI 51-2 TaxID=582515 RepID=U5DMY7_9CHRO|nr:PAS domain S-box protein [Rubidibacter lacunae]ERN41979.1 PAS domain S-box [Rubidibacter lacunae KORDI 51-2]